MALIAQYQLQLLLSAFALGVIGVLFLFRKPPGHRAWKLADLLWVVLGGVGALVAIVAGLYTADSSRLDRQIDLACTLVSCTVSPGFQFAGFTLAPDSFDIPVA